VRSFRFRHSHSCAVTQFVVDVSVAYLTRLASALTRGFPPATLSARLIRAYSSIAAGRSPAGGGGGGGTVGAAAGPNLGALVAEGDPAVKLEDALQSVLGDEVVGGGEGGGRERRMGACNGISMDVPCVVAGLCWMARPRQQQGLRHRWAMKDHETQRLLLSERALAPVARTQSINPAQVANIP